VVELWLGCRCCRPSVFYWRTTTTINPVIIQPPIVVTDGRQQWQPNHNTTTYCPYWRTTTIKHNMWSYYDWVYCCCRRSVNTICGRIMIELSLLSSVSKHNMWSYYGWVYSCWYDHILCLLTNDNNENPNIIRPHIVFTDGQQQRKTNHNTTTYCVYWRTTTTINPVIRRPHVVFTDGRQQQ
jgi:hypothetical protein